ncbi:MAG: hypothetical protein WD512_14500 [Candidatus Paceibacterota bacterium]
MSVCQLCFVDLDFSIPRETYQSVRNAVGQRTYFCMNCPTHCIECDNDFGDVDNHPGTDFCTGCFENIIQPSSFGG